MMAERIKISEILRTLAAHDQDELSVLRFVIYCAQVMLQGAHVDLANAASRENSMDQQSPGLTMDVQRFIELVPEESKKYLHGLVEALEVYQSIHRQPIPIQNLTLSDRSVIELKQIRDMCLQEGLRSIY